MSKEKEITEKYILQIVSYNVKRLRSQFGLSQFALAQCSRLTHNFINDIENCKKGVSYKTLSRLSKVFSVEPYQFFLPEDISNSEVFHYVKDFNDSLYKMVNSLTQQYAVREK